MNELIGSTLLTILFAIISYFIIASKNRWGFDSTIALGFPILIILGLTFTSFSIIYAFSTLIIGIMIAWIFQKIIKS